MTDIEKEEALKDIPKAYDTLSKDQLEYKQETERHEAQERLKQRGKKALENLGKQEYKGTKKSMSPESSVKGRFLTKPGKKFKPFSQQPNVGSPGRVVFRPRYVRREVDYKSEVGPQSRDTDGLPQNFGNVPNWNRNSAIRMFASNPLPKFFG